MMAQKQNRRLALFLLLVKWVRGIPLLHRLTWRVRKMSHRIRRWLFIHRPVVDAGPLLKKAIQDAKPYAAGKMGSTEAAASLQAMTREQARKRNRQPHAYSPYIFHTLFVNSGVFPQNERVFDSFFHTYTQAVAACDVLVAWDVAGEVPVLRRYGQNATLVTFGSLDSFFSNEPWTQALEGKRVLVISPFVESIASQYQRRETLWDDPRVLPAFTLKTLRAPFSAGLVAPQDADWFAALERMKAEMDAQDYDVALIGAGAFSLPLAAHAKERGKIGIHLGGTLQVLFGVYGTRWTKEKHFQPLIKDSWIRPAAAETPPNKNVNEGGCYW